MIIKDNDCVGCETCIGCGRKHDYFYRVCDECEYEGQLYYFEEKELCVECLLSHFEEVDMDIN